jgi:hypothetical protein
MPGRRCAISDTGSTKQDPARLCTLPLRSPVELSYYRCFLKPLERQLGLGKQTVQNPRERAEKTLLALKELKRYLEEVEKNLSQMSKKFSDKEIAHGVGFAAAGIHEALTYLAIVKKVTEKTERLVAKNDAPSGSEISGSNETGPSGRTSVSGSA